MKTPHEKVSLSTLEETPKRAVEFIRGVGASSEVMRALQAAGYTPKTHEEGIQLVNVVLRFIVKPAASTITIAQSSAPAFAAAVKEIKQWIRTDLRRIKPALYRLFPAQAEYLFTGLDASGAVDAVALVGIFLERLASLGNDPERKATRKADHAALAMIEERGIAKAKIKHLHALVTDTQATPPVPPVVEAPTGDAEARVEAMIALRAWYADWAETARVVLTRRDHLIRVGLATRKPRAVPVLMPALSVHTNPV